VNGYLLAGDTRGLVVFNTTKVQQRGDGSLGTLFRSHFEERNVGLELAESPLMSIIAKPASTDSAVLLASKDGKMIVFESRLPAPIHDGWDLSKTRLPVIAGAVMLVFGYQMYKRKRGGFSSGGANDAEMERFLSRAGGDGGFGGGGGAGRYGGGAGTRDPRFYKGAGRDYGGGGAGTRDPRFY
jgi:hypothetical protein